MQEFSELFTTAFGGHFSPYPYQQRLATTTCWPQVLSVPTGVGKTAAAVLTWVYRRRFAVESIRQATPRRLVYCLPMRTLVEQTRDAATKWLERLRIDATQANGIGIHLLMGGADDGKWYEHPERDAILIGTQDMLLSRALNRGYGMSRYAWPVQYALLNNDCQWVIDETQLMGVGLTTSAQLAGLRTKLTTIGNCPTLWMSATLDVQTLATVDNPVPDAGAWTYERLEDDDRAAKSVARLLTASKPCQSAAVSLSPETKKQYEKQLAAEVLQAHQPNTLTLVVMNRVTRAQELYTAVDVLQKKAKSTVDVKLIHSRFRPYDRQKTQPEALDEDSISDAGRIIVATQAIEAGVDVSSTTLFTELAPWSSLVQRFGRCNRRGECGLECVPAASVHWIDIDTSDAKKAIEPALPYTPEELDRARTAIAVLDDVGPRSLSDVTIEEPRPIVHVLRRKDLVELFDTTPDLSGNDLDVSRYIRDSDDTDVQVYWRNWDRISGKRVPPPEHEEKAGGKRFPVAQREELCSVGVSAFKDFLQKLKKGDKTKYLAWVWDPLEATWAECEAIRPGMTILLHCTAGGYDHKLGWTGEHKHGPVEGFTPSLDAECPEANDTDETQGKGQPMTVVQHLKDVGTAAQTLREMLSEMLKINHWDAIVRAAWWHDVGKSHPAFQGAMQDAASKAGIELANDEAWAKSGVSTGYLVYQLPGEHVGDKPQQRPGFRHELASALAWLQQHDGEPDADLVAYLIAAHHGKVRMSIRSMPNENKPSMNDGTDPLFARGIWQNDALPRIEIGNQAGDISEPVTLDLDLMQLGDYENASGVSRPSWLARTLALRDELGPFQLAYLETLVRVADWRGSSKEST